MPTSTESFTLWQLPAQTHNQMNSYVLRTTHGHIIAIDQRRGNAFAAQDLLADAIQTYKAAIAADADLRDAYYSLGKVYARREAFDEAVAQFEAAVERDSTYARAHFALGNLHEQRGTPEEARGAYAAFLRHWQGDEEMAATVHDRISQLRSD